jgi:uncharacterized membrane protein YgcG
MFNTQARGLIVKYLTGLFAASSSDPDPERSHARRNQSYMVAIDTLKNVVLSSTDLRDLCDLIHSNLKYLAESNVAVLIEKLISKDMFNCQPENLQGTTKAVELLTQLVFKSSATSTTRDLVIDVFLRSEWPLHAVPLFGSVLVEFCVSEEDCVQTIKKIMKSSFKFRKDRFPKCIIELNDIPSLLYQIALIGRNNSEFSSTQITRINNVVIDSLIVAIDCLCHQTSDGNIGSAPSNKQLRLIDISLATTLHQLCFIFSKDMQLSQQIIKCFDSPLAYTFDSDDGSSSSDSMKSGISYGNSITVAKIILVLLVSKISRLELKALKKIVDVILEVSKDSTNHVWLERDVWNLVSLSPKDSILEGLELLLSFNQITEIISPPLVLLGLLLADTSSSLSSSSSTNIGYDPLTALKINFSKWDPIRLSQFKSFVAKSSSRLEGVKTTNALGMGQWIIAELFHRCPYTRAQIVREIVSRIILDSQSSNISGGGDSLASSSSSSSSSMSSSSSSSSFAGGTGSSAAKNSTSSVIIILRLIASRHTIELAEHTADLQECLLTLPHLDSAVVEDLLDALAPLFKSQVLSQALADTCALSLRKSSFSTDIPGRKSAISALSKLLSLQMQSYDISSNRNDFFVVISIDEVLSLLRRFFSHQAEVRGYLYGKLSVLQCEHPVLRGTILRLFLAQLKKIFCKSRQRLETNHLHPGHKQYQSLANQRNSILDINLENMVDHLLNPVDSFIELILTSLRIALRCYSKKKTVVHTTTATADRLADSSLVEINEDDDEGNSSMFSQVEYIPHVFQSSSSSSSSSSNNSSSSSGGHPGMGHGSHGSQVDSLLRSVARDAEEVEENPDSLEVFSIIYDVCRSLSLIAMEDLIKTDRNEAKALVTYELLYACSICILQLPSSCHFENFGVVPAQDRIEVLVILSQRMAQINDSLVAYAGVKKPKKKKAKRANAGGSNEEDDESENVDNQTQNLDIFSDNRSQLNQLSSNRARQRDGFNLTAPFDPSNSASANGTEAISLDGSRSRDLARSTSPLSQSLGNKNLDVWNMEITHLNSLLDILNAMNDNIGSDSNSMTAILDNLGEQSIESIREHIVNNDVLVPFVLSRSLYIFDKVLEKYTSSDIEYLQTFNFMSLQAICSNSLTNFMKLQLQIRRTITDPGDQPHSSGGKGRKGGKRKRSEASPGTNPFSLCPLLTPLTMTPIQCCCRLILGTIRVSIFSFINSFITSLVLSSSNNSDSNSNSNGVISPFNVDIESLEQDLNYFTSEKIASVLTEAMNSLSKTKTSSASSNLSSTAGSRGISIIGTGYSAITQAFTATASSVNNQTQVKKSIKKLITKLLSFLTLLNEEKSFNESPIVVAWISAICSMLPMSIKSEVTAQVSSDLSQLVKRPHVSLTKAMIELLILVLPGDQDSRKISLMGVCSLCNEYSIASISIAEEEIDVQSDEEEDDVQHKGANNRFIWADNFLSAKILLISIIDMAVAEMEGLLKNLDGKVRSSLDMLEGADTDCYFHVLSRSEFQVQRRTFFSSNNFSSSASILKSERSPDIDMDVGLTAVKKEQAAKDNRLSFSIVDDDDSGDDLDNSFAMKTSKNTSKNTNNEKEGSKNQKKTVLSIRQVEKSVNSLLLEMFMGLNHLLDDRGLDGKKKTSMLNACDTLLVLLIRMYKVLIKLTKGLIERKSKTFSNEFSRLIPFISDNLSVKINKLIEAVHNAPEPDPERKSDSVEVSKSMKSKLARVVPELIYNMEQLDHSLIKLDAIAGQTLLHGVVKRSQLRDFKIS